MSGNNEMGEISDGYHTLDELYEHRHSLFLALMSSYPHRSWFSDRHDDGTFFEGWFIAGINLPRGAGTITYHLPERLYAAAKLTGADELTEAPEWDGHTAADVVERLRHFSGAP